LELADIMLDIFKFPAWAVQLGCMELAECGGMTRNGETKGPVKLSITTGEQND